jgi:hypothetical protein
MTDWRPTKISFRLVERTTEHIRWRVTYGGQILGHVRNDRGRPDVWKAYPFTGGDIAAFPTRKEAAEYLLQVKS